MTRVRTFFLEEADACLAALTLPPASEATGITDADIRSMHAAARRLRGNAQVARYGPVVAVAERLERRLRELVDGSDTWCEAVADAVRIETAAVGRAVDDVREGRINREIRTEVGMEEQHGTTDEVVAVDDLEYKGAAALERAGALRGPLEEAIVADAKVGPILDELFDLIRLGMK